MDDDPNAWLLQEYLALDSRSQRRFLSSLAKHLSGNHLRFLYELITPGLPLDPFSLLPGNVGRKILQHCDSATVVRLGRVCQKWAELMLRDLQLWRSLLARGPVSKLILRGVESRRPGLSPAMEIAVIEDAFRRERLLEDNWFQGKFKRSRFACHNGSVITCLEIDELSGRIFTGSEDHTVGVWTLSGTCIGMLTGHRGGVWAMKVLPGEDVLITGSTDRSLIVWDLKAMAQRHQMAGHVSTVRCLELWNDYAISGSRDGTLRIWNWRTGELVKHIAAHQSSVRCLALFGSEGHVVSGSYDHTCALWKIATGQLVQRFEGHTDKIYAVACTPSMIFSGSMDGTVRVWTPASSTCVKHIVGHHNLVGNLRVQGPLVASASTDGSIKVWDVRKSCTSLNLSNAHPGSITTLDMNRWLIAAGSDGHCCLWDPVTGELIEDFRDQIPGLGTVWRLALGEATCAVAYQAHGQTVLDVYRYI